MQKFDLDAMLKEMETDRPLMRANIHQLSQVQIRRLVKDRKTGKGRSSRDRSR
jgi:hypothetical protein